MNADSSSDYRAPLDQTATGARALAQGITDMPKQPPSERNRAIAARLASGAPAKVVAAEFQISVTRVKEIAGRVERYDRGTAILDRDPSSLEGLGLLGRIPALARASLEAAGIHRLEDLNGLSLVDLLRMPNIGRRSATKLIDLCAELKRSHDGHC